MPQIKDKKKYKVKEQITGSDYFIGTDSETENGKTVNFTAENMKVYIEKNIDLSATQSDWNEQDPQKISFVKNKPIIPVPQAGENITIDNSDPSKPVISATGGKPATPTLQEVLDADNYADKNIELTSDQFATTYGVEQTRISNFSDQKASTLSREGLEFQDNSAGATSKYSLTSMKIGQGGAFTEVEKGGIKLKAVGGSVTSAIVTSTSGDESSPSHTLQAKTGIIAHTSDIPSYEAGDNITITDKGSNTFEISSSGGGGGTPTLQQVTTEGNSTNKGLTVSNSTITLINGTVSVNQVLKNTLVAGEGVIISDSDLSNNLELRYKGSDIFFKSKNNSAVLSIEYPSVQAKAADFGTEKVIKYPWKTGTIALVEDIPSFDTFTDTGEISIELVDTGNQATYTFDVKENYYYRVANLVTAVVRIDNIQTSGTPSLFRLDLVLNNMPPVSRGCAATVGLFRGSSVAFNSITGYTTSSSGSIGFMVLKNTSGTTAFLGGTTFTDGEIWVTYNYISDVFPT